MIKSLRFNIKIWPAVFFLIVFIPGLKAQILIEDSVFTSTLDIYGHSWDGAVIRNCVFQNTILSDGRECLKVQDESLIDIGSFPSGLYLITVDLNMGPVLTERILKLD